jgi:hypothetical protein
MELYFLRLRLRLDPERNTPAFAEADALRQRFAETKQRFSATEMKVRDADIDFEVARSYVNAGQIDRAEPLFLKARAEGEPIAEVTIELANLALKRGDPQRANQTVRDGLEALRGRPPRTTPSAPSRGAPGSIACWATPTTPWAIARRRRRPGETRSSAGNG